MTGLPPWGYVPRGVRPWIERRQPIDAIRLEHDDFSGQKTDLEVWFALEGAVQIERNLVVVDVAGRIRNRRAVGPELKPENRFRWQRHDVGLHPPTRFERHRPPTSCLSRRPANVAQRAGDRDARPTLVEHVADRALEFRVRVGFPGVPRPRGRFATEHQGGCQTGPSR